MVILNKKQINKMVAMKEAIEAMKTAFVQLSNGEAIIPTRLSTDVPDKNATAKIITIIQNQTLPSSGGFCFRPLV